MWCVFSWDVRKASRSARRRWCSSTHSRQNITSQVIHVWGQRGSRSHNHTRTKHQFEARISNPTVLTWIGCVKESICTILFFHYICFTREQFIPSPICQPQHFRIFLFCNIFTGSPSHGERLQFPARLWCRSMGRKSWRILTRNNQSEFRVWETVNRTPSHITCTGTHTFVSTSRCTHSLYPICVAQGLKMFKLCLPSKTFPHLVTCRARHVVWAAQHLPPPPHPHLPFLAHPQRCFQPRTCADPHGLGGDGFTESEPRTGYEPKMVGDKTVGDTRVVDGINTIVTEQEGAHSTEDHKHYSTEQSQIPEIEDKFSLPYNQSLLSSTQDSMESLATPQEVDLDDEQIRRYLPEREASAERSQIYHSESLMSSSSQSLNFFGTGKPVAWLSQQKRLGQDDFSEREQPADVIRGNESVFRDANPVTQARSELMKQEYKVESLGNCINELQQQAYAQRLDLESAHHGYVESRREQVRLQEELVMKEDALREPQNSKHSWDGRNEESSIIASWWVLSVQKLRESHETIQRLTSQVQELQERMHYLNDSGEFHEVESNSSGKFSHVPSQPARISSPRSNKLLQFETWNPSGLQENVFFFCKSTFDARVSTNTLSRDSSIYDIKCCRSGSRANQHRETCGKRGWKNRKHTSNADICKKADDYELLCSCGYSTEFYGWAAKTADTGTSIWDMPCSFIIYIWKNKIAKPSGYWFWFSLGSDVMDQRCGDGRFNRGIEFIAITCGQEFPEFWNAGREVCFCFEQDQPKFQLQEEGQSRGTESPEGGPVSTRKTDRLHGLWLLSCSWCSWYSSWFCWFILYHPS